MNARQAAQPSVKGEVKAGIMLSRGTFISVFIFSCLVNILMLTGPIFMLQVYDRVLTSGSVPTLVALSAIVFVLYIYYGYLENIRGRIMVRIGRRFEESLRSRVFDTTAELALRRAPNVGGQPLADLTTIRQFLSSTGSGIFRHAMGACLHVLDLPIAYITWHYCICCGGGDICAGSHDGAVDTKAGRRCVTGRDAGQCAV